MELELEAPIVGEVAVIADELNESHELRALLRRGGPRRLWRRSSPCTPESSYERLRAGTEARHDEQGDRPEASGWSLGQPCENRVPRLARRKRFGTRTCNVGRARTPSD